MRKKLVICFFLGASINNAGAADVFEQSQELNRVQVFIETLKKKMQNIVLQKTTLSEQLADIENRYGETAALLRTLQQQADRKRRSLDEVRREIESSQKEITRLSKALSGQIRAAYAMGKKEKLRLILSQQDPEMSGRIMMYYNFLGRERLKQLNQIEESIRLLGQLDKQKQQENELLEHNLVQTKLEQNSLDRLRIQRSQLLMQLNKDFRSDEQQLSHLRESENKLKQLIDTLQDTEDGTAIETGWPEAFEEFNDEGLMSEQASVSASAEEAVFKNEFPKGKVDFPALKGKLPWPVRAGAANSIAGGQIQAIMDGVLIDAGEGAEIHAVTRGKVVYAEWLRGYGLMMIIDHGKGYMTLYAFNQSLYKRVGDWVEAGDVIASVGQSGGRSRSGLYFGIRKDGKPVNPLEWCPKSSGDQLG